MSNARFLIAAFAVGLTILGPGARLAAQSPAAVAADRLASREALTAAAADFDRLSGSPAYSETLRARARAQAADVRRRLTDGDFRVGDQLVLRIEGQLNLDDTVTVSSARRITVRGFRQLDLAGVLRSEIEPKLRNELSENLTSVTVSVTSLVRVAVLGTVANPGYLRVSSDATLDQLVTRAGGFAVSANTDAMTVQRGEATMLGPKEVAAAVAEGRTLHELGMNDGDALVVPVRGVPWDRNAVLQIASFVVSVFAILAVRR